MRLIDKKELAKRLNISVDKINRSINDIPHYKIGKLIRFNYEKVLEYYEVKSKQK